MTKLQEKDEQLRQMMEENRIEIEETIARLKEELRTRLAERDEQIGEQQAVTRRELGNLIDKQAPAAEVVTLKNQLGDLVRKQEAINGSLKKLQGSTAPAAEVATLKNQLGDLARKQDTVATTVEKLHHHVHIAPVQIVMANYEQHKRDNGEWYSDGFYTLPQGYKMCLRAGC